MTTEKIREVLKVVEKSNVNVSIIKKQTIVTAQNISSTSTLILEQSQPTTDSETENEAIHKIKIGASVTHKTFGVGKVKSIDSVQKHIVVSFSIGDKVFIFPDAINKGYLTLP